MRRSSPTLNSQSTLNSTLLLSFIGIMLSSSSLIPNGTMANPPSIHRIGNANYEFFSRNRGRYRNSFRYSHPPYKYSTDVSLIDSDRNLWCPSCPRSFQTTVSRIPWVLHSRQIPGAQVQQLERAFGGTRHEGSERMGRMDYYYKCLCVYVGRAGERLSVNVGRLDWFVGARLEREMFP